MNIIITENQISKIKEALNDQKIIYSAVFVNKEELIEKYTPSFENVYSDHSTIEFNPEKNISEIAIGEKIELKITGRLITDKVDVLIVDNKLCDKKYPHITISTASGVTPATSSTEIENNIDNIETLSDTISGVVGVFVNGKIITELDNDIKEDINIPVNVGDTVLMGKFKNKKTVIKDIDKDEYNMPTINGKKATTFRIPKNESIGVDEGGFGHITEVESEDVDLSSFEPKKELNKKFWPSDDKLNKKLRVRLLKIVDDFIDTMKIDPKFCEDTLLLGSMANYNWSKYSDVDIHILVDFKKINEDVELIRDYFDSKKQIWNTEHEDLKIYGFPIEIYVQDIEEKNVSSGVYSLEKNKWIKKPDPNIEEPLDMQKIKQKSSEIMTKIDELKDKFEKDNPSIDLESMSDQVKKLFDKVKKIRKSGLNDSKGEFSLGNIVFKVLRRTDYMGKLVDLKRNTYDKINTIK